ncbi:MAG: orotidine-5'-phosphate decarboxylase [Anaerolineae bacterium]|nr:orotidine-5'-phosphate decarboxylase [Caldilineales bacterium]MDW8269334.1 orotidine-5'-phosphate decarboxylase [Anaerolineae bacterium]
MSNRFLSKLEALLAQGRPPLCVGLDPEPGRRPTRYPDLASWNRAVIAATAGLAACYKPNLAYYEALGREGHDLLAETLAAIPPEIPVILDAKRADIGPTAAAYARACFEVWNADAVTVNPYLGGDGVRPFTAYRDRYVFVLCHTSNPGAGEVQHLGRWGFPLYQSIATLAPTWGEGNVGLVVGATHPETLGQVRALAPEVWFLVPGVGAQGGDAAIALAQARRTDGRGVLINVSRAIAQANDPRQAAATVVAQMQAAGPAPATDPRLHRLALRLHDLGCVRFGHFTLASGLPSPVYLDLRLLVSEPTTLALAAQVYAGLLAGLIVDRLAAVPYAGLPIATALSLETNLPLLYSRKEVKTHGRARRLEGDYRPGERVVVIEDLVTGGGSLLETVELLREEGLEVRDAVVLVDREQGGRERLAAAGVRLHAAYTFTALLDILAAGGRITAAQAAEVRDYLRTTRVAPPANGALSHGSGVP